MTPTYFLVVALVSFVSAQYSIAPSAGSTVTWNSIPSWLDGGAAALDVPGVALAGGAVRLNTNLAAGIDVVVASISGGVNTGGLIFGDDNNTAADGPVTLTVQNVLFQVTGASKVEGGPTQVTIMTSGAPANRVELLAGFTIGGSNFNLVTEGTSVFSSFGVNRIQSGTVVFQAKDTSAMALHTPLVQGGVTATFIAEGTTATVSIETSFYVAPFGVATLQAKNNRAFLVPDTVVDTDGLLTCDPQVAGGAIDFTAAKATINAGGLIVINGNENTGTVFNELDISGKMEINPIGNSLIQYDPTTVFESGEIKVNFGQFRVNLIAFNPGDLFNVRGRFEIQSEVIMEGKLQFGGEKSEMILYP